MSRLSTAARRALPVSDFALPGGRFPVEDRGHAQAALIDVNRAKGLSPAQRATVKRRAEADLHEDVPMGRLDA